MLVSCAALVGCTSHDVQTQLDGCVAASLSTNVPKGERATFVRACMGSKGYGERASTECLSARSHGLDLATCYYKRGVWHEINNALK